VSRKRLLRREIFGFSSVGAISFIIDFLAFNLMVLSQVPSIYANMIAILLSAMFGFLGNSLYSFKHKVVKGKEVSLFVRYVVFTCISLSLSVTATSLVLSQLSESGLVAQNIGRTAVILSMVIIRFLGLKSFVYWSDKDAGSR
jgi:putative flippase GtrA